MEKLTPIRRCRNVYKIVTYGERIAKLKNGSDTATWAAEEIERLRDAANIALGHLTGGIDGEWRDCNAIDLLLSALRTNAMLIVAPDTGL